MQFDSQKFETVFFRYFMGISALAMFIAIGVYAYLGTFSRYLSDDYCEAVRVYKASSPVNAVLERYQAGNWRAANRYSNLMFVGFGEWLGEKNMQITMSGMVLLWAIGLSWSIYEFRKFFKIDWTIQTDLFFGSALGFFILLQAPNLFQTIYWRSSMMTHFAPLVFGSFLFAFWFRQARHAKNNPPSLFVYVLVFFATFIIAGFSEPPVTTMVTALGLLIIASQVWKPAFATRKLLPLLLFAFAGALLGLLTMAFSPANINMVDNDTPSLFELLKDSFLFSFIFIQYSLKELPLSNLISLLIPFVVIWSYKQISPSDISQSKTRFLWILIVASPILAWILIAAGFSPSVYGQGYPIERMRFLARAIMTATFMFEGAVLGVLFQNINLKIQPIVRQYLVAVLFILVGFVYPLRAAVTVYRKNIEEYQTRASMWDVRNEYILRHANMGEVEIIVPGYSAPYSVKEIDDNPKHWVNICVANFYGVQSIRAVNIPNEYILEYLSE